MEFYKKLDLLDFFLKYNGLLSLKNKIPIKDNYSLSLVYSPGVGAACLEIQKNQETAFDYTNKGNSMLVITDSSGFPNFDKNDWNNDYAIPYVESICVAYKSLTNIDAYPMLFDFKMTNSAQDLFETIKNVMPAYSALELYNIDESRNKELMPLLDQLKGQFVIFTSLQKKYIRERINKMKTDMNSIYFISCIIRAALDTRSFVVIPDALIDELIDHYEKTQVQELYFSPFKIQMELINISTNYFIKNKLNQVNIGLEEIELKFRKFLFEGTSSWYDPVEPSFKSTKISLNDNSLMLHKRLQGMVESDPKITLKDPIATLYLFNEPQFRKVEEYLRKNPGIADRMTCKKNFSAIITNGTAVLGYGNIGSLAGLPVMEGKSCLFKQLGGVALVPLCLLETNPEKMRVLIERIHPIYNAINLEDIKAPECFEIEKPLEEKLDIPVFHDDQHGTAIVTVAGVLNSLKLLKKKPEEMKVIVNGGGAAGLSITELLLKIGIQNLIICDTTGAIYKGRPNNMNKYKDKLADMSNKEMVTGKLEEVIKGANIFIGVSAGNVLSPQMIRSMAEKPVIFALANPIPEILPHEAIRAGAFIVATGRSDFKNQVNNSLAFPGLFRALLDVRAKSVTLEMKLAAAYAIANLVKGDALTPDHIISNALDAKVPIYVSKAVAAEAAKQGVAKNNIDPDFVEENTRQYLMGGDLISSPLKK